MGNSMALQISGDQTLNHGCGCLCGDGNYSEKLFQNIDNLEYALEELVARRADMSRSIQLEECKGLQQNAEVQLWLSRADIIEKRARRLISDPAKETERLCMNGYCSKNFRSSYCYGERVCKMLKDVRELKSFGVSDVIYEAVNERPIKPTVGFDRMLDEAWNLFMKEEVGTLGLYGRGGVGKTTLLTLLNNKFAEDINGFDIVIWVTMSKARKISEILSDGRIASVQEELGKRLHIHNNIWAKKEEKEKASDIHKVLKGQKFVLLLDDIWKDIDLDKIGIPYPRRGSNCKIAYTARSKEARGRMSVDAEMDVACLEPDDAWDLFQKSVGEVALDSHEDIRKLAEILAARCGGLPLALTVTGAAMSSKRTVQEWYDAVDYFVSPRLPDMNDEILSFLKFSYDNLGNDGIQRCFQYCALFQEDYEIEKEALIDYWIAEELIYEENRESSVNYGYEILGKLVRTYLLIDDESKGIVKMHDLVREMALKVACSQPYNEFNFIVETGTSLGFVPKLDAWTHRRTDVRRISLMGNRIQKAFNWFDCPELLTLFLHNNDVLKLYGRFFYYMPKLVVLDLSRNYNLEELPMVSLLVSLRHLDLSHTAINSLPLDLRNLKMLIYLNLEFTTELRNINGISFLSKLQVLKLLGSGCTFSDAFSEIRGLGTLQLLTASVNGCWEDMHCNLARCIQDLSIRMLDLPSITIQVSHSLRHIEIRGSYISEICTNMGKGELPVSNRVSSGNTCVSKLSRVEIFNCDSLRHLTWLMFAPNLTHLRIVRSRLIEEIICKEQTSDEQREEVPFLRLQLLNLQDLGALKRLHSTPLPFPCLNKVVIFGCPKLKKLPLDSESAKGQNLIIDAEKEWITELEWEDDATKQRFCPDLKRKLPWTDGSYEETTHDA